MFCRTLINKPQDKFSSEPQQFSKPVDPKQENPDRNPLTRHLDSKQENAYRNPPPRYLDAKHENTNRNPHTRHLDFKQENPDRNPPTRHLDSKKENTYRNPTKYFAAKKPIVSVSEFVDFKRQMSWVTTLLP